MFFCIAEECYSFEEKEPNESKRESTSFTPVQSTSHVLLPSEKNIKYQLQQPSVASCEGK